MQSDGNLVIYDSKNVSIWSTGTIHDGVSQRRLILQNSGILAVVDATDKIIWQSNN